MTSALILTSLLLILSSSYIYKTSGAHTTTSNVTCRYDHWCGKHGYAYTWCYTDSKNNWDYCCDTPCKYDDDNALRCKSGTYDKSCGNPGMKTALGEACVGWWPCGLHGAEGYWCYTDNYGKGWGYCCHPGESCSSRSGSSSTVCNIGLYKGTGFHWKPCKPT